MGMTSVSVIELVRPVTMRGTIGGVAVTAIITIVITVVVVVVVVGVN